MTHTTGPWKVDQPSGNEGEAEVITAPCGRIICWTADTWSPEDGEASVTEEDLANGRLIAAAPELLAAIKGLLDAGEYDDNGDFVIRCTKEEAEDAYPDYIEAPSIRAANLAIAKAERKI